MPIFPASDETNRRSWSPEILAREAEWDAVAQTVFDGLVRPADAERWAAAEVLPPFVGPLAEPAGAFAWSQHVADVPLSLALAWLAFRDVPRAAWSAERRWTWGRAIDAEPTAAGQILDRGRAERELWEALRLGRIEAIGRRPCDDPLRDPGPLVPIAAEEWRSLTAFHDSSADMVGPTLDRWTFAEVTVARPRLFELWPAIQVAELPRGGRPSLEYLWRPEFERRVASGDRTGAAAMGRMLAAWLADAVRDGRAQAPANIPLPAALTIERGIRGARKHEAAHV